MDSEPLVFVTASRHRARRLAMATRAIAVLVAVWCGALAVGSVGFARLPALRPVVASRFRGPVSFASRAKVVRAAAPHGSSLTDRRRRRDRDGVVVCAAARSAGRRGTACPSVEV